jgi:hypothetical protein
MATPTHRAVDVNEGWRSSKTVGLAKRLLKKMKSEGKESYSAYDLVLLMGAHPDDVGAAAWSLISRGLVTFTPDRKLKLVG